MAFLVLIFVVKARLRSIFGQNPWFCFYRTDVSEKKRKIENFFEGGFGRLFGVSMSFGRPLQIPRQSLLQKSHSRIFSGVNSI
jgi:hypothetical protein